jgi:hypothetical protein
VSGDMWRADMILMENFKEHHKTLIKIDRRIFSHDYVPPEMFTYAWLKKKRHIESKEKPYFQDPHRSSEVNQDGSSKGQ